jgi:hypothetical protein
MEQAKFQQLKFKIYGKTDEECLEMFKPLETRYAVVRRMSKMAQSTYLAAMRYLFFLYDPGTDLNRDFTRLEDRQNEAAKISGLNKLQDLKQHDEIYSATSPDILDFIQVLLSEVYHNIDYRDWQTLQRELDELTAARWERIESSRKRGKKGEEVSSQNKSSLEALKIKAQLREDCKRIRELIEELERKIFGDHLKIKEVAYKSRFMDPESFSRASKQVG